MSEDLVFLVVFNCDIGEAFLCLQRKLNGDLTAPKRCQLLSISSIGYQSPCYAAVSFCQAKHALRNLSDVLVCAWS